MRNIANQSYFIKSWPGPQILKAEQQCIVFCTKIRTKRVFFRPLHCVTDRKIVRRTGKGKFRARARLLLLDFYEKRLTTHFQQTPNKPSRRPAMARFSWKIVAAPFSKPPKESQHTRHTRINTLKFLNSSRSFHKVWDTKIDYQLIP